VGDHPVYLPSSPLISARGDRQIPVFANFLFLKALPRFQQQSRFVFVGLSDYPEDILFFDRKFSEFNGTAALCLKYK
jgi:hypothetical protein